MSDRNERRSRLREWVPRLFKGHSPGVIGMYHLAELIRDELGASGQDQEDLDDAQSEIARLRGELVKTTDELRAQRAAVLGVKHDRDLEQARSIEYLQGYWLAMHFGKELAERCTALRVYIIDRKVTPESWELLDD